MLEMEPATPLPAIASPVSQINIWFDATSCLELEFCGNYFALDASDRAFIAKLETMFRGHASAGGEDEPQVDAAPPIDAKPDPWVCRKCGEEWPAIMGDGAEVIVHGCTVDDSEPTESPNEPPSAVRFYCSMCGAPGAILHPGESILTAWTCANCQVDDTEPELKPTQVEL